MFCILYELGQQTGMTIVEQEHPSDSCEYCGGTNCSDIVRSVNRQVSNHDLDWIIDVLVTPNKPITNRKGTIEYTSAIRLMHPFKENIWVLKGTKVKTGEDIYSAFCSNKAYSESSLKSLVDILREKCSYDAHSIEEEDFTYEEN